MATTTNFGWETPDDTDLVKDGAAAIRTALGGVDTSFVDLKGGTTGQILKKNTNTDLDFVWGAVSTTKNYSLLGSAALTGAATVTLSGISGIDEIFIFIHNGSTSANGATAGIRINGDTGSNYNFFQGRQSASVTGYESVTGSTSYNFAETSGVAASVVAGTITISGCNTAGVKMITSGAGANASGNTDNSFRAGGGYWNNTATITSVSAYMNAGSWDAGTMYVYGAA